MKLASLLALGFIGVSNMGFAGETTEICISHGDPVSTCFLEVSENSQSRFLASVEAESALLSSETLAGLNFEFETVDATVYADASAVATTRISVRFQEDQPINDAIADCDGDACDPGKAVSDAFADGVGAGLTTAGIGAAAGALGGTVTVPGVGTIGGAGIGGAGGWLVGFHSGFVGGLCKAAVQCMMEKKSSGRIGQ